MLKTTYIYWRDIPAQVIAQRGRERAKGTLSARFQEAIDRAAMRAGKGGSDAYLEEWRRESLIVESLEYPAETVERELSRIESEYSDDRLARLIRNKGRDKVGENV